LAGLGRKEFNSGDILLASEVQGYLQDQAVMVFDDATARGSAIPSPSEGMITYNKDTSSLELYDGTSFSKNFSGGLIHIDTTSVSSVSSVAVDSVFSSDYRSYLIHYNLLGSTALAFTSRLRTGGTPNSSSSYIQQSLRSASTTVSSSTTTTTNIVLGTQTSTKHFGNFTFVDPNFNNRRTSFYFTGTAGGTNIFTAVGLFDADTQFDGFEITPNTGTFSGEITVWGLTND